MSIKLYDIIFYNHQGTLKTGTVTMIRNIAGYDQPVYTLDNQAVILEDNILKVLANMEELRKEVYGDSDE